MPDSCIEACSEYPCVWKEDKPLDDAAWWGPICGGLDIDFTKITKDCLAKGYKIESCGVFHEEERINKETKEKYYEWIRLTSTPLWLDSKFINPSDGTVYLNVGFVNAYNKTQYIRVIQKDLLTKHGLVELTKYGVNFTEKKSNEIQEYFSVCLAEKRYKINKIYTRCGWHGDGFVLGNKMYLPGSEQDIFFTDEDKTNADKINALSSVGTAKGWVNQTRDFINYPNVRFEIYNACAAPLLKVLKGSSYLNEQVGRTSTGKTTTAIIAMSVWGNPDELKISTSVTATYIEQLCRLYSDLPILLDDTSLMDQDALLRMLYMIANETGKGRATKDGGFRETNRWKTVCLTTSELSILGGKQTGGADVRTIQIEGGIGEYIPDSVAAFEKTCCQNYGIIGELVIKKIFELDKELTVVYEQFVNELKQKLTANNNGGTTSRLISTYAIIATAGFVFESIMANLEEPTKNALVIVNEMLIQKLDNSIGKISARAYDVVMDWKIANRGFFNLDGVPNSKFNTRCFGNIRTNEFTGIEEYIDIIPTELHQYLDKHFGRPGITDQIVKEWKDDGILLPEGKRLKKRRVVQNSEGRTDVYQIKLNMSSGGAENE